MGKKQVYSYEIKMKVIKMDRPSRGNGDDAFNDVCAFHCVDERTNDV